MRLRNSQTARERQEENRSVYCPVIHHLPADLALVELKDSLEIELCNLEDARKRLLIFGDSTSRNRYRQVMHRIEMLRFQIRSMERGACR